MARKAFDTTTQGTKFEPKSREWNAFIRAAQAHEGSILNNDVPQGTTDTEKQIIDIQNDSDDDILQYRAVAMSDLLFKVNDNQQGFLFRFWLGLILLYPIPY